MIGSQYFETLPYNDYGNAMRSRFGCRVQKLAINARFGCPNRDGTIGTQGCSFCLNEAFSPAYCHASTRLMDQIDDAISFHATRRRSGGAFIAYLQSGTNTHASIEALERTYREILSHPDISGIIIGTRPDCINSDKLQLLHDISKQYYVAVEYGIESVDDATLSHIGRGHDFATAQQAIALTRQYGIDVGGHFIIGLPNRNQEQILESIPIINNLGLNYIKLHQLQVYQSTPLADEWANHPERFLLRGQDALQQYIYLVVDIIRRLDASISIDRFASSAPSRYLLHSPLGGVTTEQVRRLIIARILELGAHQGDLLL